jgi:hypothetical protein
MFYGCEIWTPTLKEEYRLKLFENGMLRRLFGHESRLEKAA